ncbi:helix-turn-helix domain-containing protein [Bacillus mycoides]|uniref:helix-turn-helix domain-containing protein n=1 Tax=Bacillus mycoides TaxID=1405 RepID=UPI001C00C173|nr:XRE family transcriptional regulator [Bacillus mycoides]
MQAEQIKLIRMMSGLAQSELAKVLRVPQSQISTWERGVTRPNYKTQVKIREIFGEDNVRNLDALVYSMTLHTVRSGIQERVDKLRREVLYNE